MSAADSLARAGRWLLHSGIQAPSGGFARFYNSETGTYKPVSTEITGYGASALIWLFQVTGDEEYLSRARQTARFLAGVWDDSLRTFPFEHPSPSPDSEHLAYFFDCGIIARGLIAVWREIGDEHLLDLATRAAHGMLADFRAHDSFRPILVLPLKTPLPRSNKWSRAPGCYQLKAARAWWEIAEITGDATLREAYLEFADWSVANHRKLLDGIGCPDERMDRLHAWCYFPEGLLAHPDQAKYAPVYAECIETISQQLQEIAPAFVRADVYAQLLRLRLYAAVMVEGADAEAVALAQFQAVSSDCRIDGGFYFGRREGSMSPHVNPVSTIFAMQALEAWGQHQAENNRPCQRLLI